MKISLALALTASSAAAFSGNKMSTPVSEMNNQRQSFWELYLFFDGGVT